MTEKIDDEEMLPGNEQQRVSIVANKDGVTQLTVKATGPSSSLSNLVNRNNAPSIRHTSSNITSRPVLCLLLLGSFVVTFFPFSA